MSSDKTLVSLGDFIDLFYKVKQKGYNQLFSKLHITKQARTVSKWNLITPSSDFWIIPRVRSRWNEKCTGNPQLEYEDYVVSKYLSDKKNLRMLSVGCGAGIRERKFGKYTNFQLIEGIDMANNLIQEARKKAAESNLNNLKYWVGDFESHNFEADAYDVVLFNSSLHHFKNIDYLLQNKVLPLMKKGGLLIIFEYVGPNRLQWTKAQLDYSNTLLSQLPAKYKTRINSNVIKKHIYRPGVLRMLLVDPSEAVDSEAILPSLHKHFSIIEERKVGWDISHLLFKDIAHNFMDNDSETQQLLTYLLQKEDEFLLANNSSDAVFGIYQK